MAEMIRRNKALSVSPLKTSQAMGAGLAVLGLERAIPLLHGAQGCAAFAKVFFVRHFREPIPLQTTAMDPISSVMGADDNVIEALKTVCEKNRPAAVGLLTTGLSEAQGTDIVRVLKAFRERHPEFQAVRIVPVNTPDFAGCLETGYAAAVRAMISEWTPVVAAREVHPGQQSRQINVLCGSLLTPGDVETLREVIESFDLHPVMIPNLADSLDGHLDSENFRPVTTGGTPISAFATLGDAAATLVIGASLYPAAELLHERTGVPVHRFDHLLGLAANDRLLMTLADIAGQAVPARLKRQRTQLLDAMLDTHFMLGHARIALAADPDLLHAFSEWLAEMGVEIVTVVAPDRAAVLERTPLAHVQIGDLEDLEVGARRGEVELLIGNSHMVDVAQRLGVPLLRAGFPLYDQVGGYQRVWIGYRGARQTLFDIANLLLGHGHGGVAPYHSFYSRKDDHRWETTAYGSEQALVDCERRY